MGEVSSDLILNRLHKLNAAINSSVIKTNDGPKHSISTHLLAKDGILDALLVLYDECNNDTLKKDKNIAEFIEKYRWTVQELRKLRVNLNDFEQKKVIGKGHFGVVQVVREKQTGNVYALKTMRKADTLAQQHITFFEEERDIMAKAVSPWITHLQFAFQDDQNLYLLMDFHPGGDLLSLLDRFEYHFSEDMTRFYLAEITVAINAVHAMGYVHRDIKPENMLIDRCGHIKLVDFGSSAKLSASKLVSCQMPVGTPDYIAPEVLTSMNEKQNSNLPYGIECDYWSVGIMAYEMLYGETPFKGDRVVSTYRNIMDHKKTLKFKDSDDNLVSESAKSLITGLLEEAKLRLNYSDITKHNFFLHTDWNNLESTTPPFIPIVNSVDDTSNFEEFEYEFSLPDLEGFRSKPTFSGRQLPFIGYTYTRLSSSNANDDWNSRGLANSTLNSTLLDETLREPSHLEKELKSKKKELHEAHMMITSLAETEQAKILFQMEKRAVRAEKRAAQFEEAVKNSQEESLLQDKKIQKLKHDLAIQKSERASTETKALEFLKGVKQKWKKEEQEKLNHLKQKLEMYEVAAEKLTEAKSELYKQIHDLKGELTCKSDELNNYRKLAMEKNAQLLKLMKEKEECVVKNQDGYEKKLEETLINLESEKKSLAALKLEINGLQLKNSDLVLQLTNLSSIEESRNDLTSELMRVREELDKNKMENQKICNQLNILRDQTLNDKQQHIENIEKLLESEKKECTYLKKRVNELAAKLNESIASHEIHESSFLFRNEQLETKLRETEMELSNLTQEKSELFANLSSVSFEKEEQKEKISELEVLLSSLKESLGHLETKHSSQIDQQKLLSQIELLEKQLSSSQASAAADKEKLHNIEAELRKKNVELADVQIDYRSTQRELKASQDTVSYLRERSRELRDQIKSNEEEIKSFKLNEEKLKQEIVGMETSLRKESERCVETETEKQTAILKLQEKYINIQNMAKETEELKKELNILQDKNDRHMVEKRGLDNEIRLREQEKDYIIKQESVLKQTIKDLEAKFAESQSVIESLKELCSVQDDQLNVVEEYDQKFAVLEENKLSLLKDIEILQAELKSSRSLINEEKSLKLFQEKRVKDLEATIASADQQHDASVILLKQQIDEISKENLELQSQLSVVEGDLHETQVKVSSLEHFNRELQCELDIVKEEASGHIQHIHALKESNFKLSDGIEEAITKGELYKNRIEELELELKQLQALARDQELRMKSTNEQQSKLIDFLQTKSENPPRKRMTLARFFGSREKENSGFMVAHQYRELEDLLAKERAHVKQLSSQLSKAQNEVATLKAQAHDSMKSNTASLVSTPKHRHPHPLEDLSNSPSVNDATSKQRMRHKIPHRWQSYLVMRAGRCTGCLGNVPFSRNAVRCQDCGLIAHYKCSSAIANTCGLPEAFVQHYTKLHKAASASKSTSSEEIVKGWVKVPRPGKTHWGKKFVVVTDNELRMYDQELVENLKPLKSFNLDKCESIVLVHNSVTMSELPNVNASELPYVLKIDVQEKATGVSNPIYLMTSSFEDKQKWISVLEKITSQTIVEDSINDSSKGKIEVDSLITLQAVTPLDVNSVVYLNKKTALVGAVEGLFSFEINNNGKLKFRARIEGITSVHQILLVKTIGMAVFIAGKENMVFQNDLLTLSTAAEASQMAKPSISPVRIDPLIGCHLITASEYSAKRTFLCAAASDRISILVWSNDKGTFMVCRQYSTQEPCSCFLFTPSSLIVGAERFYKIDLKNFDIKEFLDETDTSLAYAINGSAQMSSFPVAVIQISGSGKHEEYLLAFYEFCIFVDAEGRRTREFDLKFTRLPLGIIFCVPHLFILHQNSVEVFEIKQESFTKVRGMSFDSDTECAPTVRTAFKILNKPRFVGNCTKPGAVIVATCSETHSEIMSVSASFPEDPDSSSIGTESDNASMISQQSNKEDSSDSLSLKSVSTATDPNSSNSSLKRTHFPNFMRASKRTKKHPQ